jgi:hypothetical protein
VNDEVEKEDDLGGEHSYGVSAFQLLLCFPLCFLFFIISCQLVS